MKNLLVRSFAAVILCSCLCPFSAGADEVADQIKEGLQMYESGRYSEAVGALNYAVSQIQQVQAGKLKDALPVPLEGWKADEAAAKAASSAFLGGGLSASRHYAAENGQKTVDVQLLMDSPLVQSIMMIFTNPSLLSLQPDSKLAKIKDQKAIQKFSAQEKRGEITMIFQSRILVLIKGSNLDSVDDLVAYANGVDFEVLGTIISGK